MMIDKLTVQKDYATPTHEHISLGGTLRGVLFGIPTFLLFLLVVLGLLRDSRNFPRLFGAAAVTSALWGVVVSGVRVSSQWERGVILRLGKLQGIRGPGLFYVIPVVDYVRFVDIRLSVVNIPKQKVITRDNVPASIDSALFFMVRDPARAITLIQDFRFAISQHAQASLRDVAGTLTLDELLSEREQIQQQIVSIITERVRDWGLHIDSIQLQDFELPEDLKRVMSRQAAAEREKRATLAKAEGDRLAAVNLSEAATIMEANPTALELRTLQTIDSLGASQSNTIVLFPFELMNAFKSLSQASSKSSEGPENRAD